MKKKNENQWTCAFCATAEWCNKVKSLKDPACKKFSPQFHAMARELGPDRALHIRALQGLLHQINALQVLAKGTDLTPAYNELLEQTEDVLQKAWKMPVNRAWHTYWLKLPGCTCPKLDNVDRLGVDNDRIISNDCPYHEASK